MEKQQKTQEQRVNKVDEFITDATDAIKKRLSNLKTQTYIVYVCYFTSLIVGITIIVGVVMAYLARSNAQKLNEKILVDHFTWQIRTFWVSLFFTVIAIISMLTVIMPIIIGIIGFVWFMYRIVKGWIYLSNNRRLYDN